MGNLVADSVGNLYGTTEEGGSSQWGIVYEFVRPVPPKTAWTETVLHSFTNGVGGARPMAGLILDAAGNLYGTTERGTSLRSGIVFELLAPTTAGGKWKETVLHVFQPDSGDGSFPQTELTWDHSGNLIGVTPSGGSNRRSACGGNCGTVFQLSPPSTPGGAWTETILYNFKWGQGVEPRGTPVVAANGAIYGTTYGGGKYGEGVIYRLTPPSIPGGAWNYRVLHAFTAGLDGASPIGALALHGSGVLYGTTTRAGAYGGGTVFQLAPPAVAGGAWTENVLYSFGAENGDGSDPAANIVFGAEGNIFGNTSTGGAMTTSCSIPGCGAVFELTPPATEGGAWAETILHSFPSGPTDGARPAGGLIISEGVLFGVTQSTGSNGEGTVYAVGK